MKKSIVILLTLAMISSLFAIGMTSVSAADVQYLELDLKNGPLSIEADGYTQGILEKVEYKGNYLIKYTGGGENTVKFEGVKANVILDNVKINANQPGFVVAQNSDINLILRGSNEVKFPDPSRTGTAMGITGDSKLTINAEDSKATLDVVGGAFGAGIGSIMDSREVTAELVINSGIITATCGTAKGSESAAIGGARNSGIQLTINGGFITAEGTRNGPGLGVGRESPAGGNVTINGGVINAKANVNAAGIGGGFRSTPDTITINGGVINARSSHDNKHFGIGAGCDKQHEDCKVIINGGSINSRDKSGEAAQEILAKSADGKTLKLTTVTLAAASDYVFVDGKAMLLEGTHAKDVNTFHFYFAEGTSHKLQIGNKELTVNAGATAGIADWKDAATTVEKPKVTPPEKDNVIVIKPEDLKPAPEETTAADETTAAPETTKAPDATTVAPATEAKTEAKTEETKKGCGSAILSSGAVLMTASLIGLGVSLKKKDN